MKQWIRVCQECSHKQVSKPIAEYKGDSWRDVKCKRCGSEALDYGKWEDTDDPRR
jgi:DNA-directed RNA polymerase subunit RPC12/RpoP